MSARRTVFAVFVISLAAHSASARAAEPQREVSGRNFALVRDVADAMSKKQGKRLLDLANYNIVVTDGGAEYFVTFEPITWRAFQGFGSPPGEALEVVVDKKTRAIKQSYWNQKEGR